MRKIKMVVMDMDDTLLNDEMKISKKNREKILHAQDMGIKIVLASGRPTPAILDFADELRLKEYGGYIISYNGAVVIDCTSGEEISSTLLTRDNVKFITEQAKKYNLNFTTYIGSDIIIDEPNKHADFESNLTGMPLKVVDEVKDTIDQELIKVILMEEPDNLQKAEKELRPLIGNSITMNFSKPFFLEFTNIAVDKDKSVNIICNATGIKKEEVMAIGDSFNDLTMIKGAGLGVVMKNGRDAVKEHADHITNCNNTHGVAHAINKFVLAV